MNGLALVEGIDHVCCRYRLRAHLAAAAALGVSIAIEPIASRPTARLRQLLRTRRFDFVILQRKLLPRWQLGILASNAKRLIFDFDDAIVFRDSNDPRGPRSPRRAARFAATTRAADVVLAGNSFLAELADKAGAHDVRVIPTCVEVERYAPRRFDESPADAGLTLVWIGSSSTLNFLERKRAVWDASATSCRRRD